MTIEDEDFIHYIECIDCLNRAWSVLKDIEALETKGAISAAAYRYALIEYAKPYTQSRGDLRKRRKLSHPELTPEQIALHQQIIGLRDQVLAHCDLTVKQANLHLTETAGIPSYIISSSIIDSLPPIRSVIDLLEQSLTLMYRECEKRRLLLQ